MSDKMFRFMPFDSTQREVGKDYTPEALERQKADFAKRGGKVQEIAPGVTASSAPVPLRARSKNYRGPEIELAGPKAKRLAKE